MRSLILAGLLMIQTTITGAVVTYVAGTVTLTANVDSVIDIQSVQFQLDGANLGPALTVPPYTFAWDTKQVKDGKHVITCNATDVNGAVGTATSTVSVANKPNVRITLQ